MQSAAGLKHIPPATPCPVLACSLTMNLLVAIVVAAGKLPLILAVFA
jgi:hypothetical protein